MSTETEKTAAYALGLADGHIRTTSSEQDYLAHKERSKPAFDAVVKSSRDYLDYGFGQMDARIRLIGQDAFEAETEAQLRVLQDKGYRL